MNSITQNYDVVIIGGGPAGYTAAIHAGKKGLKTALIEKKHIGGTCLNVGCIPTKSLLHASESFKTLSDAADLGFSCDNVQLDFASIIAFSKKGIPQLQKGINFLLSNAQVDIIEGTASFEDKNTVLVAHNDSSSKITARYFIIATGSKPRKLETAEETSLLYSHDIFSLSQLPKSITIIGAGAIGVEFAYFFASLGTKTTVLEVLDTLLPNSDKDIARHLQKSYKKMGISIHTGITIKEIKTQQNNARVTFKSGSKTEVIESDYILSAIGRVPNTESLKLDAITLDTQKGFIPVTPDYQTNLNHIYAIGDVIDTPMLAHTASEEGIKAIESIIGIEPASIHYSNIPFASYSQPQVAWCGLTEEDVQKIGLDYNCGKTYFKANGKAVATNETDGIVKILANKQNGSILGAHVIGREAAEIIHEIVLARNTGLTVRDIAYCIHAHPTRSEAIREACSQLIEN